VGAFTARPKARWAASPRKSRGNGGSAIKKDIRQALILEIIEGEDVETQDDLAGRLRGMGHVITQATISRDIKELGLVKAMYGEGRYRYARLAAEKERAANGRVLNVFAEAFVSQRYAGNMVVVRTLPGMAQGAASAVDALGEGGVLGSIAGDDTVFVICEDAGVASAISGKLEGMARKGRMA